MNTIDRLAIFGIVACLGAIVYIVDVMPCETASLTKPYGWCKYIS